MEYKKVTDERCKHCVNKCRTSSNNRDEFVCKNGIYSEKCFTTYSQNIINTHNEKPINIQVPANKNVTVLLKSVFYSQKEGDYLPNFLIEFWGFDRQGNKIERQQCMAGISVHVNTGLMCLSCRFDIKREKPLNILITNNDLLLLLWYFEGRSKSDSCLWGHIEHHNIDCYMDNVKKKFGLK